MRDLKALRWNEDRSVREEPIIPYAATIRESIDQWAKMQTAFEWQIQQTAYLFEEDRRASLIELQERIRRLIAY